MVALGILSIIIGAALCQSYKRSVEGIGAFLSLGGLLSVCIGVLVWLWRVMP